MSWCDAVWHGVQSSPVVMTSTSPHGSYSPIRSDLVVEHNVTISLFSSTSGLHDSDAGSRQRVVSEWTEAKNTVLLILEFKFYKLAQDIKNCVESM